FCFFVFRGLVNLLYAYLMAHFTQNLNAQATIQLFYTFLEMPYQAYANTNSSVLSKLVVTESGLVAGVVKAVLIMLSEFFVFIFLYILMLVASWKITLIFTALLLLKVLYLTKRISSKMEVAGIKREKTQAIIYELANRMFGNFKQIKLQGDMVLLGLREEFALTVNQYSKSNRMRIYLGAFPKVFLETSGFSLATLLLIVALYVNQANVSSFIPILSFFVLALYRLLPSANRILSSYHTLVYYHRSIETVDEALKMEKENFGDESIVFNNDIELKDVEFRYLDRQIFSQVNLNIKKGDKIGFVGESGSGKSTLVDLIIGVHQVAGGEINVDGSILNKLNLMSWRSKIGYIPQDVYLFDGTIEENVCFGRTVRKDLLEDVLTKANIIDFLRTKQGVDTKVGEGGVQLSGGQKQRVAIARALYGQPELLVLDEATSALDAATENKIMDAIYDISEGKTLLVIAHRLSSLRKCDKIYEIKNGAVSRVIL
ncbi:ABC transporter ATP-binding protein, partial [Alphaproteobacteria bacterium]|nr:ABC transporter ATP-binding protein [Alphaproteobacteria bacterium]